MAKKPKRRADPLGCAADVVKAATREPEPEIASKVEQVQKEQK